MLISMKKRIQNLFETIRQDRYFPFVLLGLSLLSFGVLLPAIGLYSDDWHLFWLSYGSDYVVRFFFHNRPYLGPVYQGIKSIIPSSPLAWQMVLFLFKWLSATLLWLFLKQVFNQHKDLAKWMSLLFVFYPGNLILFQPIVFMIVVLQLVFFFLSLYLNALALRPGRWSWLLTLLAMVAAALNLVASEYFFFLELLRPFFLWLMIRKENKQPAQALKKTLRAWLPYLGVFLAVLAWRLFFQTEMTFQTPVLLAGLRQQPLVAIGGLLSEMGRNFYDLFLHAWGYSKLFGSIFHDQPAIIPIYFAFLVVGAAVFFYFYFHDRDLSAQDGSEKKNSDGLFIAGIGFVALLLGGLPAWLAGYKMEIIFSTENRFVLPFLPGVVLVTIGLIYWVIRQKTMRVVVLSLVLAIGVGAQFLTANLYRQEWDRLKSYYWQMVWRIPDMQSGIHLITNVPPLQMEGENSVSAGINWIYAKNADKKQIDYYVYFNPQRIDAELGELVKDKPIQIGHQIGDFSGNQLHLLAYYDAPPACLRVLDPTIEDADPEIPAYVKDAARVSEPEMILPAPSEHVINQTVHLFGSEPAHTWCYYFEKADLARQFGQWEQISGLFQQIQGQNLAPADAMEWLPFIEGLAHSNQWSQAVELTTKVATAVPDASLQVCAIWQRIMTSVQPSGLENDSVEALLVQELKCKG